MSVLPSLARAKWLKAPALQLIFRIVAEAGGEARVAGGAVRNALLKIPVADIDIATTLPPERIAEICKAAGLPVHPTGIAHGTVTVISDRQPYEVTTLRRDIATDGRRATVKFTGDWQADAMRRDFTMNAMYCDAKGKIYDFTYGYRDVLRKRIIFVGSPSKRIAEDYLRVLRFFRFHAQFGKGAPDKAGLAACIRNRRGLDTLSAERIRQEMFKLLAATGAIPALKAMAKSGILRHLLPYTENWRAVSRLPPDPLLRLYALSAEPLALKERWRLSNAEARRLEVLATEAAPTPALRPREQQAILYHLGAQSWRDLVYLGWARSKARLDDPAWRRLLRLPERWPIPVMPVTGRDLMANGMKPGPELGAVLQRLEDWWLASDFKPDKIELLKRLE
jgi:poly(A) polymerase